MHPTNTKTAQNADRNCQNHTKNAKNDISEITDILPGFSPYWLSPIISFHHIGYPRYYRDILESVTGLTAKHRRAQPRLIDPRSPPPATASVNQGVTIFAFTHTPKSTHTHTHARAGAWARKMPTQINVRLSFLAKVPYPEVKRYLANSQSELREADTRGDLSDTKRDLREDSGSAALGSANLFKECLGGVCWPENTVFQEFVGAMVSETHWKLRSIPPSHTHGRSPEGVRKFWDRLTERHVFFKLAQKKRQSAFSPTLSMFLSKQL